MLIVPAKKLAQQQQWVSGNIGAVIIFPRKDSKSVLSLLACKGLPLIRLHRLLCRSCKVVAHKEQDELKPSAFLIAVQASDLGTSRYLTGLTDSPTQTCRCVIAVESPEVVYHM